MKTNTVVGAAEERGGNTERKTRISKGNVAFAASALTLCVQRDFTPRLMPGTRFTMPRRSSVFSTAVAFRSSILVIPASCKRGPKVVSKSFSANQLANSWAIVCCTLQRKITKILEKRMLDYQSEKEDAQPLLVLV